ncbi:MAG: hypothetical protein A3F09_02255 [Chlamydiae bacterium RIFCSPHIGHO2_12_FULL_49_11]|nr:MAG: hypothetical protein A3F09_02255 [Chlamydiae bacterium RIFCSPHIGHO2_12_FULL_49_11]
MFLDQLETTSSDIICIKSLTSEMKECIFRMFEHKFPFIYSELVIPELLILSKFELSKLKITCISPSVRNVGLFLPCSNSSDQEDTDNQTHGYVEFEGKTSTHGNTSIYAGIGIVREGEDGSKADFSCGGQVKRNIEGEVEGEATLKGKFSF